MAELGVLTQESRQAGPDELEKSLLGEFLWLTAGNHEAKIPRVYGGNNSL